MLAQQWPYGAGGSKKTGRVLEPQSSRVVDSRRTLTVVGRLTEEPGAGILHTGSEAVGPLGPWDAYRRGAKAWVGICEGVFAMDMAQLEQRLTRIEDIEAIKQLKARYCAIADEDHNPDKITTLFVEDGIWEGGM